jgi:hypothetical protein
VNAQRVVRLLLSLAASAAALFVLLLVLPHIQVVFWSMWAFVPVFTGAGLLWRRHIIRYEATPPFPSGPEPERSVTRSIERPVVAGRVIASSDAPPRGKVEA